MSEKNDKKEEFLRHRISWKFFERKRQYENLASPINKGIDQILLEILKELQYLNDK